MDAARSASTCCAGRCARERPCITWTGRTASRTSTSGRFTSPSATAHFRTGGGERRISAPPGSAVIPVTRRLTPAGASTCSAGRCLHRPAPTRRQSCATTYRRRALHQRRHWQPRRSSFSPQNRPSADASGLGGHHNKTARRCSRPTSDGSANRRYGRLPVRSLWPSAPYRKIIMLVALLARPSPEHPGLIGVSVGGSAQ